MAALPKRKHSRLRSAKRKRARLISASELSRYKNRNKAKAKKV